MKASEEELSSLSGEVRSLPYATDFDDVVARPIDMIMIAVLADLPGLVCRHIRGRDGALQNELETCENLFVQSMLGYEDIIRSHPSVQHAADRTKKMFLVLEFSQDR
jgi:hypothetical protein